MQGFLTRLDAKVDLGRKKRAVPLPIAYLHKLECKACPLNKAKNIHPKMKPFGPDGAQLYILGEAPGAEEDKRGRPFVGPSGKLLRDELGPLVKKARFNNVIRDRPPGNRTPKLEEIECCRPSIQQDIERTAPKIILAVGAVATSWALGFDKGAKISVHRGRRFPVKIGKIAVWVCPVFHPAFILRSKRKLPGPLERVFSADIACLRTGLTRWGPPTYVPEEARREGVRALSVGAKGLDSFRSALRRLAGLKSVAFDIETNGLRPYREGAKVLSFSVGTGEDTVAIALDHPAARWTQSQRQEILDQLKAFLTSPKRKVVAHNLAFELEWMIWLLGRSIARSCQWQDSMQQAYILDERIGGHSLDYLVRLYFGFGLKDETKMDRSKLSESSLDKLLLYNGMDVKWTHQLYEVQQKILRENKLQRVYEDHLQRVPTLALAQFDGLPVDQERRREWTESLGKQLKQIKSQLLSDPAVIKYKKRFGPLNPSSSKQVACLFRDVLNRSEGFTKAGGYSTKEAVLSKMKGVKPAKLIINYREIAKLKSTYIDPLDPDSKGTVVWPDGLVHTSFNTTFTDTGRLSSEGPNVQNYPKRKHHEIRNVHWAGRGCTMVAADYGQIEARIIAIMSEDQGLIKSLQENYDVHMDWSHRILKLLDKVVGAGAGENYLKKTFKGSMKSMRSVVKNKMVFPAFYGSSPDSIREDIKLPNSVVSPLFEDFWNQFMAVKRWQLRLADSYRRKGYVACLTGRRRRAPLSWNMIINSPVQGTASDLVVDAMNRLSQQAEGEGKPWLQARLNIHDDLTFIIPDEHLDEACADIVNGMLATPFDWISVPITVELSAGPNWAELKEISVFSSEGD